MVLEGVEAVQPYISDGGGGEVRGADEI